MAELSNKKIYLTDLENDLTYWGTVRIMTKTEDKIEVQLQQVKVYQYSSANYLHDLDSIHLSRPKASIFIEDSI